jgi:hypothetical protein
LYQKHAMSTRKWKENSSNTSYIFNFWIPNHAWMCDSAIQKVQGETILAKFNTVLQMSEVWTHADLMHICHHLSEVWSKGPW